VYVCVCMCCMVESTRDKINWCIFLASETDHKAPCQPLCLSHARQGLSKDASMLKNAKYWGKGIPS